MFDLLHTKLGSAPTVGCAGELCRLLVTQIQYPSPVPSSPSASPYLPVRLQGQGNLLMHAVSWLSLAAWTLARLRWTVFTYHAWTRRGRRDTTSARRRSVCDDDCNGAQFFQVSAIRAVLHTAVLASWDTQQTCPAAGTQVTYTEYSTSVHCKYDQRCLPVGRVMC